VSKKQNKSTAQLFREYCDRVDKSIKESKGSFLICSQELANVLTKVMNEQPR
jgi:hypothetical protein